MSSSIQELLLLSFQIDIAWHYRNTDKETAGRLHLRKQPGLVLSTAQGGTSTSCEAFPRQRRRPAVDSMRQRPERAQPPSCRPLICEPLVIYLRIPLRAAVCPAAGSIAGGWMYRRCSRTYVIERCAG